MEARVGRRTIEAKSKACSHDEDAPPDYSSIGQPNNSRIVFLHGAVDEPAIANIIAQLLFLASQKPAPIHLVLSTYGGSLDEMFSLYDTIKFLPCPVHTVALGKVMSAGVLLLASGIKGKRLIGASSRIMVHPVSGGAIGNIFEIENETKAIRAVHDRMVNMLVNETKMTREYIEGFVMGRMLDHYLTPEEAIEQGIADKIIGASG